MLDSPVHQASGLRGLAAAHGAQLIAMVSHAEDQSDLTLLWRLCAAYIEMGYVITVLDATTHESSTAPGLAQLLESGYWPASQSHPEAAWQILAAARGLQDLHAMNTSFAGAWQQLGQLFAEDAVVLIYGKAPTIATLFRNSNIKPLLAVSSSKSALLTSYLALKRLWVDGHLEPTVVDISACPPSKPNPTTLHAADNLTECARDFLGYQVRVVRLRHSPDTEYDLIPLASRLLESGVPLGSRLAPVSTFSATPERVISGTH